MEERDDASRSISRANLNRLAELLDQFENALDPDSTSAKEAEAEFNHLVDALFTSVVQQNYPDIKFGAFRAHVRLNCLRFLAKERQKPAST